MKRLLAIAFALFAVSTAQAQQKTTAQIKNDITTLFPTTGAGLITANRLREVTNEMADSYANKGGDTFNGPVNLTTGSSYQINGVGIQVYALTYGVKAGNADDTTTLQAAIDAVNAAGGGTVILPAGTINVAGVVLKSTVYLKGAGRAATVLKLRNSANVDVMYGLNAYSLFGTLSTGGIVDWGLSDLTIDGNRANNSSGNCLAEYGFRFTVENVIMRNCPEIGWHSEGGQPVTNSMEANIGNVLIDTTGTHGAYFDGPHDSNINNLIVIDASQTTNNAGYGLLLGTNMTARVSGFHGWHRATVTNRAAFQLYDTSGGSNFTNSQFEGSYQAAMRLAGNASQFDDSNTYYSPWNTGTPSVIVSGNNNTVKGTVLGSIYIPATPDRIGLTLGGAGNTIDLMVLGSKLGAVDFTFDTGLNDVKIRGSQAGGPGYIGAPPSTDSVDLSIYGAASLAQLRTLPGITAAILQLTKVAVASLPTCNAGAEGTLYAVTDANSTTFNAAVAAGGANHVMAFCNGTGWTVH